MTLGEAIGKTKQFAGFIKALGKLQEVAQAFESYDQAVNLRKAQVESLDARLSERSAQLAEIEGKIAAAGNEAQRITKDATEKAQATLNIARDQAQTLLAQARSELDTSRNEAQGVIARAAAAERQLKNATAELEAVNTRIEKAKAEALKVFGG
jgi:chromosome segregation ATPase